MYHDGMTDQDFCYCVSANGTAMGHYTATDEAAALDAYALDAGYLDLDDLLDRVPGSTRDELTVTDVGTST